MSSQFSRRRFLAVSSAAAAGAAWFDLPKVLRAEDKNDPYGGLPMGVQSYSLRNFTLLEAIRHIQGMGLHYVEFYQKHYPVESTQQQIDDMNKLLSGAKITVNAHGVNNFTKNHEANRKIFEFAKKAGIKNLSANPQRDAFDSLDKLVAEYNIRIAIHNHGPDALYDKLDDVTKAVSGRHKLIGACVDTGHVIRSAQDPVKWIRELGPRVFGCHIKDCAEQQKRTHNVVIGKGHLDVVGTFKALKDVNFPADGAISLEYEENPQNPIDDMQQCLAVARQAIAKLG